MLFLLPLFALLLFVLKPIKQVDKKVNLPNAGKDLSQEIDY
jgi:hypothetical protein